jgi:hypothetical protein
VDPAAFERALVDEIMPKAHVARRTIARLSLDHRLLKGIGDQGGQYTWQIRASNLQMVSRPTEPNYEWLMGLIEQTVRRALEPWGKVDSVAGFEEIGRVALS